MMSVTGLPSRFFAWWFGELAGCLPEGLRAMFRRRRPVLAIHLAKDEARLRLRRANSWRELGSIPLQSRRPSEMRHAFSAAARPARLRGADIEVELPADQVLRRVVHLPLAALENLREVLSFEMDRHTPFKAEEVSFDYRVVGTDAAAKRIAVDIAVVPRVLVEQACSLVASFGLALHRIGFAGDNGDAREPMNLILTAEGPGRGTVSRRLSIVLALLAAMLAISAAYVPLHLKRQVLAVYEARLEQSRAAVAEADAFKQQVGSALERTQFLVDRRRSVPTMAALLNEVTERLPDDTWLIQLRLHGDQITLSGFSPKASSLIAGLEDSALLSEVRFASPVTVDPRIGHERFHLSADVTTEPGS